MKTDLLHAANVAHSALVAKRYAYMMLLSLSLISMTDAQHEEEIELGSIKVVLMDSTTRETIPFAKVQLVSENNEPKNLATNIDGEVNFTALEPGVYQIKCSYIGYHQSGKEDLLIEEGKELRTVIRLRSKDDVNTKEEVTNVKEQPEMEYKIRRTEGLVRLTRNVLAILMVLLDLKR